MTERTKMLIIIFLLQIYERTYERNWNYYLCHIYSSRMRVLHPFMQIGLYLITGGLREHGNKGIEHVQFAVIIQDIFVFD